MASGFGRARTNALGMVDTNQTQTPQQRAAALMSGQGQMFGSGFGKPVNLASQQAYDATLPGGSAPAYDRMREEQRLQTMYGPDMTYDKMLQQNRDVTTRNFGAPVDMNTLPMAEFGRLGNPVQSMQNMEMPVHPLHKAFRSPLLNRLLQ